MAEAKRSKLELPNVRLDQRVTIREKIFFVGALVGLFVLFINMLWVPLSESIEGGEKELEGIQQQADALSGLIEATKRQILIEQNAPREEIKLDERTKKMLERRVVDPLSEIHTTVGLLSGRRLSRSVKVDDVDIGQMVEQESYSVVPISLHLRGRFGAIQNYFSAIKSLNRPIMVKTFRLSRDADSVGMLDVSADLELFIPKR